VNLSTFAVGDGGPAAVELDLRRRVEAFERGLIAQALAASGGNKSEAARRLGINRVTLLDKLRKHGLSAEGEGG
jgi:two-component system response regulator HydG